MRSGDEEQRVVRAHGSAAFDATRHNDSAVTHKGKCQGTRNKDNNNILLATTATTPSAFFVPVQHDQMLFIIITIAVG
jgi:hypothetical protein